VNPETIRKVVEYARLAAAINPSAIESLTDALKRWAINNGYPPDKMPSIREAVVTVDLEIDQELETLLDPSRFAYETLKEPPAPFPLVRGVIAF